MRILLDTNILIHREANRIINEDIGTLFGWFDKLHYEKCIHPLSLSEIQKHKDGEIVKTIKSKIRNYTLLKTEAPESPEIQAIRDKYDRDENDGIDTSLLKEVFTERVNYLITEDRKIHRKAIDLEVSDRIFSIDSFLEKVTAENPTLAEYQTLSVRKEYFGNIDVNDHFFDSFRNDYQGFDKWLNLKADEIAYICRSDEREIVAFLYVKVEGEKENYSDIDPIFDKKKRLKIGTLKVISNGFKLGERFLKIIFDNALRNKVDEIYVTLFDNTEEQERLIGLLNDWGFYQYGIKHTRTGDEQIYVKDYKPGSSRISVGHFRSFWAEVAGMRR
jgi:predicted nucleic acid-binding protein